MLGRTLRGSWQSQPAAAWQIYSLPKLKRQDPPHLVIRLLSAYIYRMDTATLPESKVTLTDDLFHFLCAALVCNKLGSFVGLFDKSLVSITFLQAYMMSTDLHACGL